jgi:hypothetical protein
MLVVALLAIVAVAILYLLGIDVLGKLYEFYLKFPEVA